MSNEVTTLRATLRSDTGTASARNLRRSGHLPAVVYGHGDETRPLVVEMHDFERLLARVHAATTVIALEVEGSAPQNVLIREIQRHPFRSEVLHVDFLHIRAGQTIAVQIPVRLEGLAKGVELGGIMQQILYEIEVECVPSEIPPEFTVDVTTLDVGDSIHIGDLDAGAIVILDDADSTICTCVQPTVITVEEEEEEEGLELEEGEVAGAAEGEAAEGAAEGEAADEE